MDYMDDCSSTYEEGVEDEKERILKIIYIYFMNNMDECMEDYYELEKVVKGKDVAIKQEND